MQKTVKPFLKSLFLSVVLMASFYVVAAFLIYKNEWGDSAYFYAALLIHCAVGAALAFIFTKNRQPICILPPMLLDLLLPAVLRQFHYHFIFLPLSAAAVFFIIDWLQRLRASGKKNSIKQIRRKYERLHKK
ncbi:MAG: hypothetical protein IJI67_04745 [Clostridia bacterium]|nr:hypothetical protein [Clostridia bacterium]